MKYALQTWMNAAHHVCTSSSSRYCMWSGTPGRNRHPATCAGLQGSGVLPWWPHAAGVTRVTPTVPGRVKPFTSHHRPLSFPQLAAAFAACIEHWDSPQGARQINQKPISLNKCTQIKRHKICSENELSPSPFPPNSLKPNNSTDQTWWSVLQNFTDYINFP